MTSEAIWRLPWSRRPLESMVNEVIEHHMPISHGPCHRWSIGPSPSCFQYLLLKIWTRHRWWEWWWWLVQISHVCSLAVASSRRPLVSRRFEQISIRFLLRPFSPFLRALWSSLPTEWNTIQKVCSQSWRAGVFVLKHESSIFRSFIKPCM